MSKKIFTILGISMFIVCALSAPPASAAVQDGLLEYYPLTNTNFQQSSAAPSAAEGDATKFWRSVSEGTLVEEDTGKFGIGWTAHTAGTDYAESFPNDEGSDWSIFNSGTDGWSTSFWVMIPASGVPAAGEELPLGSNNFDFGGFTDADGWAFYFTEESTPPSSLTFQVGGSTGFSTAVFTLPGGMAGEADAWHHVVGTYNGTDTINVYYDGAAGTPAGDVGPVDTPTYTTYWAYALFHGVYGELVMDEFGLWHRELTAGDVADIWNGGTGTTLAGVSGPTPTPTPTPVPTLSEWGLIVMALLLMAGATFVFRRRCEFAGG